MWNNRNIWIIMCGEMIAGLGLWIGIIGNLEFMQERIPSDFMKALILSIGLFAGILVGPTAGRIIDQSKKKTVLLVAGFGRLISVVFMLLAIAFDSIGWMIVFVILIQVASTFYFPALQSAIPLVVKEEELLRTNSVHMNIVTISRVVGTALAGILVMYWTLSTLYWVSMIAYVGLLISTMLLQIPEETTREAKVRNLDQKGGFKEVFPVLKKYPAVGITLIMTMIPLLFLGSFNLIVINLSEIQNSASIKGLVYTFEGIAFLIGSVTVSYLSKKWKTSKILFTFASFVAISEMLLFFASSMTVTLFAFSLLGFSLGCFFPTAMVVFQKQMPKAYHGRFFSFRNMLERVMFQVVLLSAGILLDLIGLQMMVIFFGIVSLSLTTLFFMQMRKRDIQIDQEAVHS